MARIVRVKNKWDSLTNKQKDIVILKWVRYVNKKLSKLKVGV